MTNSLADQIVDAIREVDAICGNNEHVINDAVINEVVEFAANGRHADSFDLIVGAAIEPRVRIVTADPDGPARYLNEPAAYMIDRCSRCSLHFGPRGRDGEFTDHGLGERDRSRRTLWMPAGSAIVELVLCKVCADYLDADFSPVEWR